MSDTRLCTCRYTSLHVCLYKWLLFFSARRCAASASALSLVPTSVYEYIVMASTVYMAGSCLYTCSTHVLTRVLAHVLTHGLTHVLTLVITHVHTIFCSHISTCLCTCLYISLYTRSYTCPYPRLCARVQMCRFAYRHMSQTHVDRHVRTFVRANVSIHMHGHV